MDNDLIKIKQAYPDKEFKAGTLDGYMMDRAMTYKMLYPSGWRLLTVQKMEFNNFAIILTVGDHGTDITNYTTVEEVIKALQFRF